MFVLSKDDRHISIVANTSDLEPLEREDIENGLYFGWDASGYPINLKWNKKDGPKVVQVSTEQRIDELRKAVFEYVDSYAAFYRPDKAFIYDKTTKDLTVLIESMRTHINEGPFKNRVRNFFLRF
jgi:hypothetical protein